MHDLQKMRSTSGALRKSWGHLGLLITFVSRLFRKGEESNLNVNKEMQIDAGVRASEVTSWNPLSQRRGPIDQLRTGAN